MTGFLIILGMGSFLLIPTLLITAVIAWLGRLITKRFSERAQIMAAIVSGLLIPAYLIVRGFYLAYPWPLAKPQYVTDALLQGPLLICMAVGFVPFSLSISFGIIRGRPRWVRPWDGR